LAVFADHGRFEGVDVGAAGFVFLFHLDGIPEAHEIELAEGCAGFGVGETGKIRPSMPMSPTWVLLGMPPRAIALLGPAAPESILIEASVVVQLPKIALETVRYFRKHCGKIWNEILEAGILAHGAAVIVPHML
jgi:hypothetical protein